MHNSQCSSEGCIGCIIYAYTSPPCLFPILSSLKRSTTLIVWNLGAHALLYVKSFLSSSSLHVCHIFPATRFTSRKFMQQRSSLAWGRLTEAQRPQVICHPNVFVPARLPCAFLPSCVRGNFPNDFCVLLPSLLCVVVPRLICLWA